MSQEEFNNLRTIDGLNRFGLPTQLDTYGSKGKFKLHDSWWFAVNIDWAQAKNPKLFEVMPLFIEV